MWSTPYPVKIGNFEGCNCVIGLHLCEHHFCCNRRIEPRRGAKDGRSFREARFFRILTGKRREGCMIHTSEAMIGKTEWISNIRTVGCFPFLRGSFSLLVCNTHFFMYLLNDVDRNCFLVSRECQFIHIMRINLSGHIHLGIFMESN